MAKALNFLPKGQKFAKSGHTANKINVIRYELVKLMLD